MHSHVKLDTAGELASSVEQESPWNQFTIVSNMCSVPCSVPFLFATMRVDFEHVFMVHYKIEALETTHTHQSRVSLKHLLVEWRKKNKPVGKHVCDSELYRNSVPSMVRNSRHNLPWQWHTSPNSFYRPTNVVNNHFGGLSCSSTQKINNMSKTAWELGPWWY